MPNLCFLFPSDKHLVQHPDITDFVSSSSMKFLPFYQGLFFYYFVASIFQLCHFVASEGEKSTLTLSTAKEPTSATATTNNLQIFFLHLSQFDLLLNFKSSPLSENKLEEVCISEPPSHQVQSRAEGPAKKIPYNPLTFIYKQHLIKLQ